MRWSGRRWPRSASSIACGSRRLAATRAISIIAINLLVLGFILLAVGQTIASWSADLVEGRRRVRVFIVGAAAFYGGMNAILADRDLQRWRVGRRECRQHRRAGLVIVAAICYAMMRVDGAGTVCSACADVASRGGRGAASRARRIKSWSTR